MKETKFGGKNGAHSEKFSLASENHCFSEKFCIFLRKKQIKKLINKSNKICIKKKFKIFFFTKFFFIYKKMIFFLNKNNIYKKTFFFKYIKYIYIYIYIYIYKLKMEHCWLFWHVADNYRIFR